MKVITRQIVGYLIGGLFALIIFPCIILGLSFLIDNVIYIELLDNRFIEILLSTICIIVGIIFAVWSLIEQNRIGQGGPLNIGTIEVSPKTKYLVTTGPYRYSRNPMFFGAIMIYLGLGFIKNTISIFISILFLLIFMISFVIRIEEKRLVNDFGNDYLEYKKRTSILIPWMKLRNQ